MASLDLDAITTELMITGGVEIDDAPPGFDRVVALINMAQGPATAGELAARAPTVTTFAARVQSRPVVPARAQRRFALLKFPAKVLALTVPVVFLGGSVAVATGSLPPSAQAAASRALSSLGISVPKPQQPSQGTAGSSPSDTGGSVARGTGAEVAQRGRANPGLCRTWRAGRLNDGSAAYRHLAAAAGGTGNLAAYCAGPPASSASGGAIGHAETTSSGQLDGGPGVTTPLTENRQKAVAPVVRSKPRAIGMRHMGAVKRGRVAASTSSLPTTPRRLGPKTAEASRPLVASSRRTPVSAGLLVPRGAHKATSPDRSRRHLLGAKARPGRPSVSQLSSPGKPSSTSPMGASPVSPSIASSRSPSHHHGKTGRPRRARGCRDSARPRHATQAHHLCRLATPTGSKSNPTSIGSKRHDPRSPTQGSPVSTKPRSVKHGKTM
jgi:hypothetical protein